MLRAREWCLAWIVLLSVSVEAAGPARADVVTLSAVADTTLYEASGELGNGKGKYLFVGRTGRRHRNRTLLDFDIGRALPQGAKISSVSLVLSVSRAERAAANLVRVHRISAAWSQGASQASGGEGGGAQATDGDATWTHRTFPAVAWLAQGADFVQTESASTSITGRGVYTWSGPGLVADVQAFLDDPTLDHGWIMVGDADLEAAPKRFDSRDNSGGAPPRLVVTYDPPTAATGVCCLSDGDCGVSLDPGTTCGGTYLSAASECAVGVCPELEGACCIADARATCESRTRTACGSNTWLGPSVECSDEPCPVVLEPFVDPLPLPAVALPTEGENEYRLSMVELKQKLHRDLPETTVWGYSDGTNAGYPGPTIEARTGTPIGVTWVNDLRDETGALRTSYVLPVDTCVHGAKDGAPRVVVHLHGGHVPAGFDGHPDLTLLPGEQTRYEYPNAQRAATIWYHDHAVGVTRLNVYMGLAAFYLIRDAEEDALGLPSGKYEVALAIQDRSFHPDGSLRYPAKWQQSFFGTSPVVNGKVSPYLNVDRGLYRFRVLNGSTSRGYVLSLSNQRPFLQIGNDGGLLPESISISELSLAPGERADIVIDFQYAAKEVILQNTAKSPFPNGGEGPDLTQIMKFIVGDEEGYRKPVPVVLSSIAAPDEASAAMTRDIVLERSGQDHCGNAMWMINGKEWDDITEKPLMGTSEVWRFVNRSGVTHPMHLHALFFRVLDRQPFKLEDDQVVTTAAPRPPERGELGWKDTVQVGPFEIVRVLARFEDYPGRFPYHCHLLEHEDHGMMRQFEIVTVCGDKLVTKQSEECDDGNRLDGDGCSAQCKIEAHMADAGSESSPASRRHGDSCNSGSGAPAGSAWPSATLCLLGYAWLRRARRNGWARPCRAQGPSGTRSGPRRRST